MISNNTQTNGNAQFLDGVMIYQSMSGDADSDMSSTSRLTYRLPATAWKATNGLISCAGNSVGCSLHALK